MRIALYADLHANREALTACFEHARAQGAQFEVFLGDFVGYGADPAWVVDTVRSRVAKGAAAVRGNHEAAVVGRVRQTFNPEVDMAIAWTRRQLDPAQLGFLSQLPITVEKMDRLYVHANAHAPLAWGYIHGPLEAAQSLCATACRLTFCGHVHEPALYHLGPDRRVSGFVPVPSHAIPLSSSRRWLAIVGSAGQPRDGNPAACYAIYDTASNEYTLFRVPYDVEAAARKIREAGLPERFSSRLEASL